MKMTFEIDDALLAQVQALAARENVAVSAFVERALRERVEKDPGAPAAVAAALLAPLPVCSGAGGMYPWIDPCSNESMLDAMDNYP